MYDAGVVREFQTIDFIKTNFNLSTHWNVGFLIEVDKYLVKYGSEHVSGKWKYPVIWSLKNVEKMYELAPSTEIITPAKISDKLPDIVYVRWGDGQVAEGKVSKETIISRKSLKQIDTIGFLLDVDKKRIVVAEELSLEDKKARTVHAIYPEFANGMLYLYKRKEGVLGENPNADEIGR